MRHITSFFNFIRVQFGTSTCKLLKDCIKLFKMNVILRIRIRFIKACINRNIVPGHLKKLKSTDVSLFQKSSFLKLKRANLTFTNKILKIELRDAYKHLHSTRMQIFKICKTISNILPTSVESAFFSHQEINCNQLWVSQKSKIDKKIEWLTRKSERIMKQNIKPITYYAKTKKFPQTTVPLLQSPMFLLFELMHHYQKKFTFLQKNSIAVWI